jgi:hypothetical protein
MPGTPHVSVWLSRSLVESLLIVVSIMGALALDEWQEDREIQELVDRSVASFAHELQQNHDRVEAVRPYHEGLHQILERRIDNGGVTSINEFRNIMEHPAHHLDVRVPLYNIEAAQRTLNQQNVRLLKQPLNWAHIIDCTRRCKLYDYTAHRWLSFDGEFTSDPVLASP